MKADETTIDVVIPAFNEAESLPLVLAAIPRPPVRRVVVTDNNSTDETAQVAHSGGAEVVFESRSGYGGACLRALRYLRENQPPDVVVFLDADFSDHPEELPRVVAPIVDGTADLVIGSRVLYRIESGSRRQGPFHCDSGVGLRRMTSRRQPEREGFYSADAGRYAAKRPSTKF